MNREMLTLSEVQEFVDECRSIHAETIPSRARTRDIVNGGPAAIRQLIGSDVDLGDDIDMPAPNLMFSGMERLAQKLEVAPMVKVDPPDDKDSKAARKRAARVERIVETYDEVGRLELQLQKMARWVPGYGFGVWVIRERFDRNGHRYPVTQLRDPYMSFPSYWGPDGNPDRLAIVKRVPAHVLRRTYPALKGRFNRDGGSTAMGYNLGGTSPESPGATTGYIVIDYFDHTGSYTYVEDIDNGLMLEATPNVLETPRFVVPHRATFDALLGQFEHMIGMMAMMAKLNVLTGAAFEDGVNTETNIFGQMLTNEYERGRDAVNEFELSARVEKPTSNIPYQLFEQIDRLERQMRLTVGYPITDDAESPNAFVTGRGLEELGAGSSRIVNEYQTVFRYALQDLDRLRLQWDEEYYHRGRKPLFGINDEAPYVEKYVPSTHIKGWHRTRREYGMMAGWDDPTMIVTGIQLLREGVIDVDTFRENLRGLRNLPRITDRIRKKAVEENLLAGLGQRFGAGDPRAEQALVAMYTDSPDIEGELKRFFTAQDPEMTPEEAALIDGGPTIPAQPPPVTTVLSQLSQGGEVEGGVQTVRTKRG